jgi:hypothetical protein
MAEKEFTCRYCGRPIAVAMSTCPWPDCRETIMSICAACRAYTDNRGEFCEHCGEPLVEATFEEVELSGSTQELLVQLAQDQKRAHLVASGVTARYSDRFLSDTAPMEGVLADLLGVPLTYPSRATAVVFAAVAYLVQAGYCQLKHQPAAEPEYLWTEAKEWDGQMDGLEARMADQAWRMAPLGEAVQHMIATETGLLLDDPQPDDPLAGDEQDPELDDTPSRVTSALNRLLERLPRRQQRLQGISPRPAVPTIVELGWETVLPKHQEEAACEKTRQLLVDFEEADPLRARYVLDQIYDVMDWFDQVEQDPQAQLPGWDALLPEAIDETAASGDAITQSLTRGGEGFVDVGDDRALSKADSAGVEAGSAAAENQDAGVEANSTTAEGEATSPPIGPEGQSPGKADV